MVILQSYVYQRVSYISDTQNCVQFVFFSQTDVPTEQCRSFPQCCLSISPRVRPKTNSLTLPVVGVGRWVSTKNCLCSESNCWFGGMVRMLWLDNFWERQSKSPCLVIKAPSFGGTRPNEAIQNTPFSHLMKYGPLVDSFPMGYHNVSYNLRSVR